MRIAACRGTPASCGSCHGFGTETSRPVVRFACKANNWPVFVHWQFGQDQSAWNSELKTELEQWPRPPFQMVSDRRRAKTRSSECGPEHWADLLQPCRKRLAQNCALPLFFQRSAVRCRTDVAQLSFSRTGGAQTTTLAASATGNCVSYELAFSTNHGNFDSESLGLQRVSKL